MLVKARLSAVVLHMRDCLNRFIQSTRRTRLHNLVCYMNASLIAGIGELRCRLIAAFGCSPRMRLDFGILDVSPYLSFFMDDSLIRLSTGVIACRRILVLTRCLSIWRMRRLPFRLIRGCLSEATLREMRRLSRPADAGTLRLSRSISTHRQ